MADWFDHIDERLKTFIEAQHIFFVGTAPTNLDDGFVNVSPKGRTLLHVLGPNRVGYLDYPGSGNETAKHTNENGRITIMLCSFDATAMILRLYGRGHRVDLDDPELLEHRTVFDADFHPYVRQAFIVDVEKVQTSCGYAVPRMEYVEDRLTLDRWCENKVVPREMLGGLPQPGRFEKKDGSLLSGR